MGRQAASRLITRSGAAPLWMLETEFPTAKDDPPDPPGTEPLDVPGAGGSGDGSGGGRKGPADPGVEKPSSLRPAVRTVPGSGAGGTVADPCWAAPAKGRWPGAAGPAGTGAWTPEREGVAAVDPPPAVAPPGAVRTGAGLLGSMRGMGAGARGAGAGEPVATRGAARVTRTGFSSPTAVPAVREAAVSRGAAAETIGESTGAAAVSTGVIAVRAGVTALRAEVMAGVSEVMAGVSEVMAGAVAVTADPAAVSAGVTVVIVRLTADPPEVRTRLTEVVTGGIAPMTPLEELDDTALVMAGGPVAEASAPVTGVATRASGVATLPTWLGVAGEAMAGVGVRVMVPATTGGAGVARVAALTGGSTARVVDAGMVVTALVATAGTLTGADGPAGEVVTAPAG